MHQTLVGTLWERGRRAAGRLRGLAGGDGTGSSPGAVVVTDGGTRSDESADDHLADVPDGAGCTEIWEHLSERQAAEAGPVADD